MQSLRRVLSSGGPYILSSSSNPLFDAPETIKCRTDVEREDGRAIRFWRGGVVVDDVSNLPLLAVDSARDEPIVAIEGRFGSV